MAGKLSKLPGLNQDSARILIQAYNGLVDEVNRIAKIPRTTKLQSGGYVATEGETVRMRGGERLTLPRSRTENTGAQVHVIVETSGTVSVVAQQGQVNALDSDALPSIGLYTYQSNGVGGWFSSANLSAVTYTAGSRLTLTANEFNVKLDAAFAWTGIHSWNTTGDWIVNSTDGIAISASATPIASVATGDVCINADSGIVLQAGGTPRSSVAVDTIELVTNDVTRLAIEPDGSFNIDGSNGTAGQVFNSNGAGAAAGWGSSCIGADVTIQSTTNDVTVISARDIFFTHDGSDYLVIQADDATGGFLSIEEAASSLPSVPAGEGMFWVRNDANNVPMFTDDNNVDGRLIRDIDEASDTSPGVLETATQTEQEAGSSTTKTVTPGRQHFHPSACKCWGFTTGNTAPALGSPSYNVTSITDLTNGRITVTIATDFSSTGWSGQVSATTTAGQQLMVGMVSKAAGTINFEPYDDAGTAQDPGVGFDWAFFGDL